MKRSLRFPCHRTFLVRRIDPQRRSCFPSNVSLLILERALLPSLCQVEPMEESNRCRRTGLPCAAFYCSLPRRAAEAEETERALDLGLHPWRDNTSPQNRPSRSLTRVSKSAPGLPAFCPP